jgi:WD40 repeat protein/serine/threonine protein kinase
MAHLPGNEESIFLAALERGKPDERVDFVDNACANDAELRLRVLALLKTHDESRGPFDAPSPGLQGTLISPEISAVGDQIGPYRLLQQIGEGGMGTVYMAEQARPVKRKVALKVIKAGMDSRQVIARFEAERQALAVMDHVNIARVLDAGTTEGGRPFFVMELVHGVPITKYCDDSHLTPRQRLELFVPVCQAIQHAHQKGIIHRDIKPSNVMITLYDGKPVPKVIDFGVAKATEQALTERTLFTQYGTMVGTLEYMSPEQAEMSALGVDTRSDIYSLGVLLYELLTGSTPLSQKQLRGAAYGEILRMIKEDEPPKPSTRLSDSGEALASISAHRHMEPAKLTNLVRGELDWIVMKTLEKDRNRRYETANGVAADLLRYLNDEPVLACPPSSMYRIKKFARRNKSLLATVAALAILLIVATIGALTAAVQSGRLAAKEQELRNAADERRIAADERADAEAKARAELDQRLYANRIALAQQELFAQNTGRAQELLAECPEALRGWEWNFLKRFRPGNPLSLAGDQRAAVFSPDGRFLAVSSGTNANIIDPATGNLIRTLHGLATYPDHYGLAFCEQSGETILAAGDSRAKNVKVWNVATGQEIRTLGGHGERLRSVVFSPDGRRLAAGSISRGAKIWDWKKGRVVFELPDLGISRLAYSPDGQRLAVAAFEVGHDVTIYQADTGQKLRSFESKHSPGIEGLSYSPNSQRLATSGNDGTVKVWDETTGNLLQTLRGHVSAVKDVVYTTDGRRLASAGWDKTVKLWDAETGQELLTLRGHADLVMKLAFSRSGDFLATSGFDGAKVWNATSANEGSDAVFLDVPGHSGLVKSVAFSPDGRHLASAGTDRQVKLWDVASLRQGLKPLGLTHRSETDTAMNVVFSPDSRKLVSAGWGRRIKIWETGQADPMLKVPLHTHQTGGDVQGVAFSPDGRRLATAGPVWMGIRDSTTGEILQHLRIPSGNLFGLTYSPDGRHIALCHHTSVMIVDAQTATEVRSLGHGATVRSVAYSADGQRLATACFDHSLRIWDTTTWKEIHRLRGHTDRAMSVAFSPDGKRLASGSGDSTLKVWDAATGQELATLRGHTGYVWSVAFSPDGKRLASAGGHHSKGEVKVWDLTATSPAAIDHARQQAIEFYELMVTNQPKVWEHRRNLGHAYAQQDQWVKAVAEYTKAIELYPEVLNEVVDSLRAQGQLAEVERVFHDLVSRSEESGAKSPAYRTTREMMARHFQSLGSTHSAAGRAEEARKNFRKSADLATRLASDFPDVAWYREHVGHGLRLVAFTMSDMGDAHSKEKAFREAVDVFQQLAIDYPDEKKYQHYLADTQRQLGRLSASNQRWDESASAYRTCIEIHEKLITRFPNTPNEALALANDHNDLATTLKAAGRLVEAEQEYRQALALKAKLVADFPANPDLRFHLAHSYLGLAYVVADAGRESEAVQAYTEAANIFQQLAGDGSGAADFRQWNAHALWRVADAWLRLNHLEEAQEAYAQALLTFQQLATAHPENRFFRQEQGFSHRLLANYAERAGRKDDSQRHQRAALDFYEGLAGEVPDSTFYRQEVAFVQLQLAGMLARDEQFTAAEQMYDQANASYNELFAKSPADAAAKRNLADGLNHIAWPLVMGSKPSEGAVRLANAMAERGVELHPAAGHIWSTVNMARYRAGNWTAALSAADKAEEQGFRNGAFLLFVAMTHWQLGNHELARERYDTACQWIDKNQSASKELRPLRKEAEDLIQMKPTVNRQESQNAVRPE